MTNLPDDAALRIARWCWPERQWISNPDNIDHAIAYSEDPHGWYWDATELDDVRAAEQVVIERGLAEEYGRALCIATKAIICIDDDLQYDGIAAIATAPLDARVRALLTVIEKQEARDAR